MVSEKYSGLSEPERWKAVLDGNTAEAAGTGILPRYHDMLSRFTANHWEGRMMRISTNHLSYDEREARRQTVGWLRVMNEAVTADCPIGFRTRPQNGTEIIEVVKVQPDVGQTVASSSVNIGVVDLYEDVTTPYTGFTPGDVALAQRRLEEQERAGIVWPPAPIIFLDI